MGLTTNDIKLIKDVMKVTIDEELGERLEERLEERFGAFPTKEEFYTQTDKIMGELKAVREEMTTLSDLNRKVNNHEERIEKVEKVLDIPALE